MRYPVKLAMRYRGLYSSQWFDGQTLNVSASGVLFARDPADVELRLRQRSAIEMDLQMPDEISGAGGARVRCTGYVTRMMAVSHAISTPQAAVTIDRYRFEPVR